MPAYLTSQGRNRPWTPGALKALKRASAKKTIVAALSAMLKRSETALRQKARELGLPLGPYQRKVIKGRKGAKRTA